MRVISLDRLRSFWEAGHTDAEHPLRDWFRTAEKAQWTNLRDVRADYPSADGVKVGKDVLTVFNIGGNKYRLITRIRYDWRLINVRAVLSHAEYNKGKWKE